MSTVFDGTAKGGGAKGVNYLQSILLLEFHLMCCEIVVGLIFFILYYQIFQPKFDSLSLKAS